MATVLHLIESWGPGGAETIFVDVAEGVSKRGWRSLAVVPRKGWVSREVERRGMSPVISGGKGSFDIGHLMELRRLLLDERVDVVHSHLFGSALYGGVASMLARVPSIATFHGMWDTKDAVGARRIKIPLVHWANDRKVFVSEALRRQYTDEVGGELGQSVVVENGIDTDRFRPRDDSSFRRELGVAPSEFLIGAIGNVRPAKNHGLLMRTASRLGETEMGFRVVLVGKREGQLFEELQKQRADLGLEDRVRFTGFREDVPRILNSLDAYVLTSDSEGFSLTTVQAMASGIPVVATRCGGPEELVTDGVTGFLVERGNARALAAAIGKLMEDDDLRDRMGRDARLQAVNHFSLDRMIGDYEQLYRELISPQASTDQVG